MTSAAEPIANGDLIDGRFEAQFLIEEGGFARVWRALDTQTGATVAIKHLRSDRVRHRARFARETTVWADLDHPNIVRLVAHGELPGTILEVPYLVLEFIDGPALDDALARTPSGTLDLDTVRDYIVDVLAGLQYVHDRGAVHRDIKPSNILIDDRRGAMLTDFGLVLPEHPSFQLTTLGSRLGTMQYAAPEQLRGEPTSPGSDLYAIGVVLVELATGFRPQDPTRGPRWEADPLERLADAGASTALVKLVSRLLDEDQGRRPRSARETSELLTGAIAS